MSVGSIDVWYLRTRGKVLGPFALRQLEVLRNQGRLAKFDEVSQGDRRSWVLASTVPELFPAEVVPESIKEEAPPGDFFPLDGPPDQPSAAVWHYLGSQGASAPLKPADLSRLAATGAVTPETLVWTAEMSDWAPAKTVPLLASAFPPASVVAAPAPSPVAPAPNPNPIPSAVQPGGGTGFAVAALILGLLSLLGAILVYVLPFVLVVLTRNDSALSESVGGMLLIGVMMGAAVLSLLALTFGSIGMIKAGRDEKRRGFGLGLAALILGMLSFAGLAVVVLLMVLGMMSIKR